MTLTIPSTHTAGDTLEVEFSDPTYSRADGWTAELVLNGPALITVDGAEDPDDPAGFVLLAARSATADWITGTYRWFLIFTSGDSPAERVTLDSGPIVVEADPTTQSDAREQRTFAELQLEKIETLLAAQGNALSYSLFNRSYTYESRTALLAARRQLRQEIAAQREADRRAAGKKGRNVAYFHFGRGGR